MSRTFIIFVSMLMMVDYFIQANVDKTLLSLLVNAVKLWWSTPW